MTGVLAPVCIGVAFGWALQKARLGRYETIVDVFRLVDLTVLRFLLTALLVSTLGVQALVSLGVCAGPPVAQTYAAGNLLGGLLFGAGMALAGFCPGTVMAGAGEGRLDTLVPGTLGLFAGAVAFGWAYPRFFPALSRIGWLGSVTGAAALHVEPWLLVALFWEVALLVLYAVERGPLHERAPAS